MADTLKVRDMRKKERFSIDDVFVDEYARLCSASAHSVYMGLCRHADKGQTCWPAKKTLAEKLGLSERTVYGAVKELEALNIIAVEEAVREGGKFASLTYTLLDSSQWQTVPTAKFADGKKQRPPSAKNDIHRRQNLPSKDINTEGYTKKDIVAQAQPTPAELAREFFMDAQIQEQVIQMLTSKGISSEVARTELGKFIRYWTEPTKNGKQQRWEREATFEVKRRLVTWFERTRQHQNSNAPKGIRIS